MAKYTDYEALRTAQGIPADEIGSKDTGYDVQDARVEGNRFLATVVYKGSLREDKVRDSEGNLFWQKAVSVEGFTVDIDVPMNVAAEVLAGKAITLPAFKEHLWNRKDSGKVDAGLFESNRASGKRYVADFWEQVVKLLVKRIKRDTFKDGTPITAEELFARATQTGEDGKLTPMAKAVAKTIAPEVAAVRAKGDSVDL